MASTSAPAAQATSAAAPVATLIEARLRAALPGLASLELVNESYKHSVPKGSETHFKVTVVAPEFEGLAVLARHRLVNAAVKGSDAALPVHALSIAAWTPEQAAAAGRKPLTTPGCLGGTGK